MATLMIISEGKCVLFLNGVKEKLDKVSSTLFEQKLFEQKQKLFEQKQKLFEQCIVNNYESGQGINKHIDLDAFGPVIGCFSLGSGCTMRFSLDEERVDIYIEPNSLYVMSGDARSKWTHEMPATKTDLIDGKRVSRNRRVSLTFRSII